MELVRDRDDAREDEASLEPKVDPTNIWHVIRWVAPKFHRGKAVSRVVRFSRVRVWDAGAGSKARVLQVSLWTALGTNTALQQPWALIFS